MVLSIGSRLGPGAVVIVSGAVFRVTLHLHDENINTQSTFNNQRSTQARDQIKHQELTQ